jgi:hypothetical protein
MIVHELVFIEHINLLQILQIMYNKLSNKKTRGVPRDMRIFVSSLEKFYKHLT